MHYARSVGLLHCNAHKAHKSRVLILLCTSPPVEFLFFSFVIVIFEIKCCRVTFTMYISKVKDVCI
jgi:hypothetical protein